MKRVTLLILAVITLWGCDEDIQDNSPALQGAIDNVFFRANDARAAQNDDDTFVIQGYTAKEILTLRIVNANPGIHQLGGNSQNFAAFEDADNNIYVTNPDGAGEVIITDWDASALTLSGTFKFRALIPGVDTLFVDSGEFYKVSYATGLEEPIDPSTAPGGNAGTFIASIDDTPFNPIIVSAIKIEEQIVIKGETTGVTITLALPVDVVIGSYSLPRTNFNAVYTDANGDESLVTGNIIVIGNDPITRKIKGTFSFETASHSINFGQFNVVYE